MLNEGARSIISVLSALCQMLLTMRFVKQVRKQRVKKCKLKSKCQKIIFPQKFSTYFKFLDSVGVGCF